MSQWYLMWLCMKISMKNKIKKLIREWFDIVLVCFLVSTNKEMHLFDILTIVLVCSHDGHPIPTAQLTFP